MTAGERILVLLKYKGITQEELGRSIGLTRGAVSSIIHGKAALSRKNAKLICMNYPDISEEWLMEGEGEMVIDRPFDPNDFSYIADEMNASPALRSLIAIWAQLDDERQRVLEQFVADYVDEYLRQREEMFLSSTSALISDIPSSSLPCSDESATTTP